MGRVLTHALKMIDRVANCGPDSMWWNAKKDWVYYKERGLNDDRIVGVSPYYVMSRLTARQNEDIRARGKERRKERRKRKAATERKGARRLLSRGKQQTARTKTAYIRPRPEQKGEPMGR